MVVIECNGGTCRIVNRIPSVYAKMIGGQCSYLVAGYEHMADELKEKWDGYIRLYHKGHRTFPIGLLPIITDVFIEAEIPYAVQHSEINETFVDLEMISDDYEPRPYQVDAHDRAIASRVGVIRVATGGGKTVIAGHIMATLGMPTIFLVHTKDLLYQAIEEFGKMFGEQKVGQIGDGVVDIREITVSTIQTLSRVFDFEYERADEDDTWKDDETSELADRRATEIRATLEHVGVIFMDECHRVAAPTAQSVMEQITNARFRIGLSASPWRDDGADLAIQACLGPVCYSITASDLIELGYLVAPIIRVLDVPSQSFPRRTRYATVYKEYIVENEWRNRAIVEFAASMVRRKKPVLILVQRIRHGELLQRLLSERLGTWVTFLSGRDSAMARKDTLDAVRERRCGIFIASTIADEGLDLKPLTGLILAGGGKSSVKALQRIGRTLRPFDGKTGAEIIDFDDNAKWLINHSMARQRLYDTERLWKVIDG